MNYQPDVLDHVFTLAHEAGHSMHSYYSAKHQPYQYYNYTIFVAEVASTFNEQLLSRHLMDAGEERRRAGVPRSTARSTPSAARSSARRCSPSSRRSSHALVEAGEPLTVETLQERIRKLLDDYFGPDFAIDDELKLECLRIPHFYRAFYVYKYATGLSAAIALSERVLSGGKQELDDYLSFLKGGCSNGPARPAEGRRRRHDNAGPGARGARSVRDVGRTSSTSCCRRRRVAYGLRVMNFARTTPKSSPVPNIANSGSGGVLAIQNLKPVMQVRAKQRRQRRHREEARDQDVQPMRRRLDAATAFGLLLGPFGDGEIERVLRVFLQQLGRADQRISPVAPQDDLPIVRRRLATVLQRLVQVSRRASQWVEPVEQPKIVARRFGGVLVVLQLIDDSLRTPRASRSNPVRPANRPKASTVRRGRASRSGPRACRGLVPAARAAPAAHGRRRASTAGGRPARQAARGTCAGTFQSAGSSEVVAASLTRLLR